MKSLSLDFGELFLKCLMELAVRQSLPVWYFFLLGIVSSVWCKVQEQNPSGMLSVEQRCFWVADCLSTGASNPCFLFESDMLHRTWRSCQWFWVHFLLYLEKSIHFEIGLRATWFLGHVFKDCSISNYHIFFLSNPLLSSRISRERFQPDKVERLVSLSTFLPCSISWPRAHLV